MRCGSAVEAVVELIAVNVVAIEIGAAFLAMIAIAAVASLIHIRLLERAVARRQAELRAQRAQAAAARPFVAEHPSVATLVVSTAQNRWAKTQRARPAEHATAEPPAERPASPRVAAR
jgi:hypothetical protein